MWLNTSMAVGRRAYKSRQEMSASLRAARRECCSRHQCHAGWGREIHTIPADALELDRWRVGLMYTHAHLPFLSPLYKHWLCISDTAASKITTMGTSIPSAAQAATACQAATTACTVTSP
jgi:hypothetical protein